MTVKYQINGGPTIHSAPTSEWGTAARRYDRHEPSTTTSARHGHRHRPRRQRQVWFEGGGETSDSFTYTASASRPTTCSCSPPRTTPAPRRSCRRTRPADRTTSPSTRTPWRRTASSPTSTTSTPTAARRRRTSACSATTRQSSGTRATTSITREPGWVAGNASRLAMDEMLHVRAYLNEGGKVLYTGKYAGHPVHAKGRCAVLRPDRGERTLRHSRRHADLGAVSSCTARLRATCRTTSSSTGSARTSRTTGPVRRRVGNIFDVIGTDTPFTGAVADVQRRRQRGEPGLDDARSSRRAGSCPPSDVPAVRELGGRRSTTGRAGRSTRTPGESTRTRRSQISRTSA